MRARAALAALAAWAAAALPDPGSARGIGEGAPTVTVTGPVEDTLPTLTPTFTIATQGFDPAQPAVSVRLLIATDSVFARTVVDTTVFADAATIALPRPLPDGARVFWRATARAADGSLVASPVAGPRFVRRWLVLIDPNAPTGATLGTRRPRFVWRSAPVDQPPGPWIYTLELLRSGVTQPVFTARGLRDTAYVPGFDLDLNSSYRWRVTARLTSGDSVRVASTASFVITDPGRPVATLLYQSFPNPFPRGSVDATCIWFDLREPSLVRLEIFDIRANPVRRIIPGAALPATLPSGRYGRASDSSEGGCDPRFTWDGTADDGRMVSPGVYLVRLTAGGQALTRRIVFRGR